MANVNRPEGLVPVRTGDGNTWNQQATLYWIPSADTSSYYIGDIVKLAAGVDAGGTTGLGVTFAPKIAKATTGDTPVGVLVSVMSAPGVSLNTISIPATKAQDYAVMVVDDPATIFEATDDGITSANLVTTAVGKNCSATIATPTAPVPISATVLTSSTFSTTTTALMLKIVGLTPLETNSVGAFAKWLVRFNTHAFLGSVPGV